MANWDNLKASIAEVIKTNGNQEITGQILQNALSSIISNLGENATFVGIATPTTNPGVPDGPVFYLAFQSGTYSNFNSAIINNIDNVKIFKWDGSTWSIIDTGLPNNSKVTGLVQEISNNLLSNVDKITKDLTEKVNETVQDLAEKVNETVQGLTEKVDNQKDEVNIARDEAIQAINSEEQSVINNFNAQRVTPEMLSESTLQLINSSGGGTVTNMADDEDLYSTDGEISVLKFKDKDYVSENFSGLGRIYLRKNIQNGKNILTQNMINKSNVRYIIQYDYDLNGVEITIPENCVLDFKGGSLKNGSVEYNHTIIENSIPKVSIQCNCKGIIKFKDAINIYDCGAKGDGISDDIQAFNVAIKSFQYYGHGILILGEDTFCISTLIKPEKIPTLKIIGNGASIKNITTSSSLIDKYSFNLNSVLETGSGFFPTNDEGCLIKAAKAGYSSIVLKDSSYVSKIIIGRNYRITSDCIQKQSFPYNHYNFEIITPIRVDGNTVYLKNKLKYDYHETTLDSLYDNLSWTPSARLWTGNNIAFCSDNFYIENVKFLGDDNQLGGIGIQNCRNITVKNCYIQANLSFGEADNIEIINCYITGILEPDKHINVLTIKNCTINTYSEGTGIKYLNLINNNINSLVRVYGFNITIKGNTIWGREFASQGDSNAIVVGNSVYPIDSLIIENNLIINRYKDKTDVLVPAILLGNGCQITSGIISGNSLTISKYANNFEGISYHAIIGMAAYFNDVYYEVINVEYLGDNLVFYFDKEIDDSIEISSTNVFYLGIFKYIYIKNNYYDGWYPINTANIVCRNKVIEDIISDDVMKFTYRTGRRADSFNAASVNFGNKILERLVYLVKSPTKISCTFRTNIVNIDLSIKGVGYIEYGNYLLSGNSSKPNIDLNNIKTFYPQLSDINIIDDFNGEVEIYLYLGYKKGIRTKGHSSEIPDDAGVGDLFYDYDNTILKAKTASGTWLESYFVNPNWGRKGSMSGAPLTNSVPIGYIYQNEHTGLPCFYMGDRQYINSLGYPATTYTFGQSTQRPQDIKPGYMYYDTTLGKPIWWTGSKWIDATGTEV